ncbi:D-amino-acid oxidase [Pseudocercospora fuligena]|uniref:D-amino-acid oxidase n=1 Tax=Pseudocercospora fuligena TaxID=685502 RepID=A0A8H6RPY4_9PEZI|nr:D-amino-acid oxidase [Pseudocercospora fuligena]
MASKPHVVVIGAGVIGLTNAVFLAEAGYTVTIIAAHVPGDESIEYTSPWAGAHWRTHASNSNPELCDWDVQTFKFWEDLLLQESKNPKLQKCGVKMQISNHFWDNDITESLWWSRHVKDFAQLAELQDPVLSINKASPSDMQVKWAATSKAPSLDVNRYLLYLQERARKAGAILFQSRLPIDGGFEKALETAEGIARAVRPKAEKAQIFVNCSGLGAMKLSGDDTMFPIRGQTVLVKGEAEATRTRYHAGAIGEGVTSYCIPRPGSGTTILGGTKEKGEWSEVPSEETKKTILERCSWMVPELLTGEYGGFEVISTQCGLRPGREGGPRVESEVVGSRKVVHAYGHAGGGYQASIGSTRKVLKLVEESLSKDAARPRL